MEKIKQSTLYLPLLALVGIYAMHAFGVFMPEESEEFYGIVSGVGFGGALTTALVWAVLPLDGTVALLLFFGNKVSNNFPWGVFFLWVGLWPWVPRVLEIYGGLKPEVVDSVVVSALAALAYYLYKHKNIAFFSRN